MSQKRNNQLDLCMLAFLFDSGKVGSPIYGEKIFECLVTGDELSRNAVKVVVSEGDVLQTEAFDDITPFVIRDELCTVRAMGEKYRDYLFAVLIEDILAENAKRMDNRLKKECPGYLGMTSVDVNSADARKQFWKCLIRRYSIEMETITFFGYEEAGFPYVTVAKNCGFRVNYDNFPDEMECDNQPLLFSTRQSSFITSLEQLEVKKGRNDSDRGISEMNSSLVREVEIAGVQIWKAIEDINQVYIPKSGNNVIVDYLFTSLYQAAQGIERLLKIAIELMVYDNSSYRKQKTDELLMGHNHAGMCDFIEQHQKLSFKKSERKLINLVSRFYNEARYGRFRYNENNIMELKLLQEFGCDLKEDEFDDKVKRRYGKAIGSIAHTLYGLITDLSYKLNIFVYELNYDSVAYFSLNNHYKDDLYGLLKDIENSKRELLWYALTQGKELGITTAGQKIEALPFENAGLQQVFEELICNRNSGGSIYDFVSSQYDEQVSVDKEKWKERLEFISMIGNLYVYCDEGEEDEEDGLNDTTQSEQVF